MALKDAKRKGKKVRIGRGSHRKNVCVVGEVEEGPKLSELVRFHRCRERKKRT
jgi:hypothetical protein